MLSSPFTGPGTMACRVRLGVKNGSLLAGSLILVVIFSGYLQTTETVLLMISVLGFASRTYMIELLRNTV